MTRILMIGYDPQTLDFSDPGLPPGMTAAKIHAGIQATLKQMADRDWDVDICFVRPDQAAAQTVERQLAGASYTCVLIGAGLRLPTKRLTTFEAVINAVHKAAPSSAIVFSARPEDCVEAVDRWLPR